MVSVKVKKDHAQHYTGFICSGHAEYDEPGMDIVCAAISILTQTIANSLETCVGLTLKIRENAKQGYLNCAWENQPETTMQSDLLIQTLILGLSEIQKQYPDHLSLCEMEV